MVAILTRNTLFAAGAFVVVAYMGYKDDIFNSKDSDANKKVLAAGGCEAQGRGGQEVRLLPNALNSIALE